MKIKLSANEKAGSIIVLTGAVAAVFISMFVDNKPPETQSFLTMLIGLLLISHVLLGVSLWQNKPWARIAGIIWGIIYLFGSSVGTLAGAYVLWCLIVRREKTATDVEPKKMALQKLIAMAG